VLARDRAVLGCALGAPAELLRETLGARVTGGTPLEVMHQVRARPGPVERPHHRPIGEQTLLERTSSRGGHEHRAAVREYCGAWIHLCEQRSDDVGRLLAEGEHELGLRSGASELWLDAHTRRAGVARPVAPGVQVDQLASARAHGRTSSLHPARSA